MRFVSFFAGIGGFDLGLERAGHECVGQVEIDPYCLRVLDRHWPDVPRFGDIRTLDPAAIPDAELWCGGFPCQPFSVAGARRGAADERHLWPAFAQHIADRRPRWLFLENVPGLLTIDGGRTFGGILADLAAVGYVGEWTVLGARDVGALHRRDRLWFVATNDPDSIRLRREGERPTPIRADEWSELERLVQRELRDGVPTGKSRRMADVVPGRVHVLRALGNAVVPQVVEAIARKVWG